MFQNCKNICHKISEIYAVYRALRLDLQAINCALNRKTPERKLSDLSSNYTCVLKPRLHATDKLVVFKPFRVKNRWVEVADDYNRQRIL